MEEEEKMDISKYRKNKELEISNDDFDIEKLEKDIRKGYVLSEEVEKAKSEATKENTNKYVELEAKYNDLDKSFNDLQAKNVEQTNVIGGLKLQVEMMDQGFKKEKFEEVSKLRNSLYADEKDDAKAISMIKQNFGGTYFPKTEEKAEVPEDSKFSGEAQKTNEIKITRKTSLKDLLKK